MFRIHHSIHDVLNPKLFSGFSRTDHFEKNPDSGANFKDLPSAYVERLVKAIAGFELVVEKLEHVFKLSQNRDEKSYDNIITRLSEQHPDAKAIAKAMASRKSKIFK